jgi:hypothetical protein
LARIEEDDEEEEEGEEEEERPLTQAAMGLLHCKG